MSLYLFVHEMNVLFSLFPSCFLGGWMLDDDDGYGDDDEDDNSYFAYE